jgi:hypothetical protein
MLDEMLRLFRKGLGLEGSESEVEEELEVERLEKLEEPRRGLRR